MQAVTLTLTPDRAMYRPGDTVTLSLDHRGAETPRVVTARLVVRQGPAVVREETASLDLNDPKPLAFSFPAPDKGGYGADLSLTEPGGENGPVLESASTAFDVHDSWLEAPRYGFLTDFFPGAADKNPPAELARYHVNALQFYDWMYRHDEHIPPTETFVDPLGRTLSLDTTKARIEQAHAVGMAAMPYTTIYASSMAYFKAHPEQALRRFNGTPWNFGDNFLMTMNPSAGTGWRAHILSEYDKVLNDLNFDGLHIDQYGDPKIAQDSKGDIVQLADVIPGFLHDAKLVAERHGAGRDAVVFNLVNDWPVETVAPAKPDVVYIEVWPPHDDYPALRDLVYNARELSGGRNVILAAYLSAKTDYGTRLLDSVIAAAGGSHLELGEDVGVLAEAYFPRYEHPGANLKAWLGKYYDFITRHQHYLYDGLGVPKPDALAVSGAPFSTGSYPANKVWGLVTSGSDFEALHLVNLLASNTPTWKTAKDKPPLQKNLQVS
ncbi:MAG TPA: glycoside hydrolase family 66 protein, partial [Deinococcales bacterium]|nr:glycoside hydrolase family 66 protein [Deinococcales bacterium]